MGELSKQLEHPPPKVPSPCRDGKTSYNNLILPASNARGASGGHICLRCGEHSSSGIISAMSSMQPVKGDLEHLFLEERLLDMIL